ncbi:hypothetical protein SAMN05421742_107124 [Roseospirillum parvum]|uniref:Uncharacterized protein n=2 Tax=Roseospirillum parvum TaxID=83401 RepID=A0A1G8CY01_9PROT|nr:hypothetical protein SAMN05421742_107124 [Roseospirillum parvum]
MGPDELPPVTVRALTEAWDTATRAGHAGLAGPPLGVRFQPADGDQIHVLLADPDLRCWSRALAREVRLDTPRGMSLCLRLIGLIGLLAEEARLADFFRPGRGGAPWFHPALLQSAARLPLGRDGGFDRERFLASLPPLSG